IKKPNDAHGDSNVATERGRKSITRQEVFPDVVVEHTTKPASTSFHRPAADGAQATAPIVSQLPRESSPADINKESPILVQTPEQHYIPSDFTNNVTDAQRRDYGMAQPVADQMDYRPEEPEIVKRVNDRRPPVGGRLVLPPVDNATSRPHYYVDSEYTSQPYTSHRPTVTQLPPKPAASVPPIFSNSDYGRVLTVTQDFNATSGEQITVNRGNKVVLIKSGTRGWIFIKDADSQRTGWIPAPFVEY
ncbi:variant SH3 domain protein, partial [Oesophagostomum dentatum]